MTPADKKEIQKRAKKAKMTVTEYLTVCGLGKEIVEITGLEEVLSELKAHGRNLNQLTTLANMGRIEVLNSSDMISAYTTLCEQNDAGGIGLFRSEFLYLGRTDFPTEEEQFQAYRQAAQAMEGKPVVIRTLDIGADKQANFFHLEKENNPALGYRAIRICLRQPEIFQVQLRALLRASVFGSLSILYPMITSVKEIFQIREIVEKTARELKQAQVPYQIPKQGIMIETPAAVMISDELASLVDFFSIGTNDLTQYTLAMDRQNEKLADFYDPRHKAVLRMIQMTVDNAHRAGIRVGICGELGADTELTEEFVRMGMDELSVPPSMILRVRKRIREIGEKCG